MITYNKHDENIANRFAEIKEAYSWYEKYILERFQETKNASRWVDPYMLGYDFISAFTPIEFMAWQAIRSYGKAPFYPQYPVGKYFLDFGNPIVKVGIECDGAEYHSDKKKDLKRDTELLELGWRIYRISGADCNRIIDEPEYQDDYHPSEIQEIKSDYYSKTIEGLLESIGFMYFNQWFYGDPEIIINLISHCLSDRISIDTDEFRSELSIVINNYYNKQ